MAALGAIPMGADYSKAVMRAGLEGRALSTCCCLQELLGLEAWEQEAWGRELDLQVSAALRCTTQSHHLHGPRQWWLASRLAAG